MTLLSFCRSGLSAAALLTCLMPLGELSAQSGPAGNCNSDMHRQFDFWVGRWDVFRASDDSLAGTNVIEKTLNGCVLVENWTGVRGMVGRSLNIYDASRKRWHQTWVDSGGTLLLLEGGFSGGVMTMSGETVAAGATVLHRITWSPIGAGAGVRQVWQSSQDNGKTWSVVFDGRYVKRQN